MLVVSAWIAGALFGFGLIVGGMTNPAKVIAFLDLAGQWDPSLAFVMGGAMSVAGVTFALANKRAKSILGAPLQIPRNRAPDRRLVFGSLAFGVGWGLGGFCPGPAVVAVASGAPKAIAFTAAMLAGMALFELIQYFTRTRA